MEINKEENKENRNIMKELLHVVIYVLSILAVTYLIIHFVGQRTIVVGTSMRDTLQDGDNLVVDKITYRMKDPERFDIIVFPYQYEEDVYYIKRIIGLPGETVQIDEEGQIFINGEVLNEDYGREVIQDPGMAIEPITLGEEEYFVLGDNRNASEDSRFEDVGVIHMDDIVGRAIFRIYPFSSFGKITD
ncbi:MAG: signal peptidase I [Lachnospiraceae bacterium]